MYPYFLDLGYRIIDSELTKKIENFTLSNLHLFNAYRGKKSGILDGNYGFGDLRELMKISEISDLVHSFNLSCIPNILYHKPFSKVRRHYDDPVKRNTVIITPISPLDFYPPTHFYENGETSEVAATCKFDNCNSFLVNTQKWHDLENNQNSYRVNLQMCFNECFDELVERLTNNNLLR